MRPSRAMSLSLLILVASSACAPERATGTESTARRSMQGAAARGADALPREVRSEEAGFASLAARVPSSAGYYLDADGNTVLPVRDSADVDAVRQAFLVARPSDFTAHARGTGVRVVKAQFSFGQLTKARDAIFEAASESVFGINYLDMDEVRNRVVVGVDRRIASAVTEELRRFMKQASLDADAVVIEPSDDFIPTTGAALASAKPMVSKAAPITGAQLNGTWPTLAGGIYILTSQAAPRTPAAGQPGACSLGFTAYYTPSVGAGYRAMVTATHCTAVWGAPDGTTFSQGGLAIAGTATEDPNKYHCGLNWCRASDAAMFSLSASMPYELGLIVRTTFASTGSTIGSRVQDTNSPWFVVTMTSSPPVGAYYSKMGWNSGWTTGQKTHSCVDHFLGNSPDSWVTRCSDVGTALNLGGDSGGSVFARLDSNNVSLIGTTVGLKTIFPYPTPLHVYSPFSRIASDMGGTMVVTRQASLAAPNPSAAVVSGHAQLTWPAVVGATEYQVLVQEVDQMCDEYWGCWLIYGPEVASTVSGTTWQDPRSTFLPYYVDPNGPHMRVRVVAKNPMLANFSPPSAHMLFSHP